MKKTIFSLVALLLLSLSLVLAHGEGMFEGTTETGNSYDQHMGEMMKDGCGMMDHSSFKNKIGGGNMVCGMASTGMFSWGFYKLFYFAVAVFIFSVIFWLTHNWLVKHKKK
ncbi:hypothetical protein CEE44_03380 [Candidatus Woesearchaeota archaeon B3_Woes]|nr:MAG: hypothetical protein CEE44_03380 [Candidatus Woesearchaeota archaeon B3_Woes]